MKEEPVIRLVSLSLLRGDDEIDRGADRGDRSSDKVVIGVTDDGEPITRAEPSQRGRYFGMRSDSSQD